MDIESRHNEDEAEEVEERSEITPPGFAASLALKRVGEQDPDAKLLLQAQARALRIQTEHLHEQREVQLSHLKARRLSEWLKVGLQLLTALVGIAVAAVVLAMVVDAARSRDIVVDEFDAPPALAGRGLTGRVVAVGMLDALTRLQAATRVTAAKRRLASAWRGDIKVEVPETGVSIGELRRLLHGLLGHDLHLEGDLVQTEAGGLSLTVRGDGVPARTFAGAAADLDKLTTAGAEYIYGAIDPYLLATYLSNAGRTAETLSFLAAAYPDAAESEQPDLLNQWGNAFFDADRPLDAIAKYRAALALKPDFWKAWGNLILALQAAGREEAAWRSGVEMARAKSRLGQVDASPTSRDAFDMLAQDWTKDFDDLTWDVRTHGRVGTSSTAAGADLAWVDAERHDWAAAEDDLDTADPDDPSTAVTRARVGAWRDLEAGDAVSAARELGPAVARVQADPSLRAVFFTVPCELALADLLAGRVKDAAPLLAAGGPYVLCRAVEAEGLQRAGDWPAAAAAYRAAVALAPDLPLAYQRFGLALLRRNDPAAAEAQFRLAHLRAPHWADPLKGLGDALTAQGRWPAAVAAYDAALVEAPRWAALRTARETAATHARR